LGCEFETEGAWYAAGSGGCAERSRTLEWGRGRYEAAFGIIAAMRIPQDNAICCLLRPVLTFTISPLLAAAAGAAASSRFLERLLRKLETSEEPSEIT
jgi:hypothetical protein